MRNEEDRGSFEGNETSDRHKWMDFEEDEVSDEGDSLEEDKTSDGVDDFMNNVSESLSSQIKKELGDFSETEDLETEDLDDTVKPKKSSKKRILIISGCILGSLLLIIGLFGKKIMYNLAARFIHNQIENVEPTPSPIPTPILTPTPTPEIENNENPPDSEISEPPEVLLPRQEDYVMTCLLFGIEEIYGARNTDSMMLAAINTKDKTVKLASIMRDSYVQLPGHRPCKLNAVYAMGEDRAQGAELLVQAIEELYKIKIDAYASVNFESFEDIVDLLGGVTIELTKTERDYLNTTNYISNPANRRVVAGVQTLNGNQVVGYCRVRYVPTLGGAADDYGRTLRQRRVLNAIFEKYKSKGFFELISIANTCLGYITSNLTVDQISKGLEMVIENGITSLNSSRFPVEGTFYDCGTTPYNGLKYTLVCTNPIENTSQMYQFIFGDTKEEAIEKSKRYYEDTAQTNEP